MYSSRQPTTRSRRGGQAGRKGGKVSLKVRLPTAGSGIVLDRELDSEPEEPLLLEEQFILRVPQGSDVQKKVAAAAARQKTIDPNAEPWFRFLDSRRALFGLGDARTAKEAHPARLVDLPCILESHKTLDNARHMYKVADISQMLVVEPGKVDVAKASERQMNNRFDVEEYVWPHGITPPLRHVRKRRFRKRANKRTIEAIEKAVERILEDDSRAQEAKFELVDAADDHSDPSDIEEDVLKSAAIAGGDGEDGAGEDGDIDADMQAALAAIDESDSDESSESGGGGGLFGSDDEDEEEDALVNATVAAAETAPARRGSMSEDDESSAVEDDDPALAEARERVSTAASTVRDRTAMVEAKTREMERLQQPMLRQRAEASLRQLKQSLDQAKSEQAEATAELERLKQAG